MDYLSRYPTFYFKAKRLAKALSMNSFSLSKTLSEMYRRGLVERKVRRNGKSFSCSYRIKKN
jgi:Mn-dependent DtxR family transcriptional regulator